MSAFDRVLHAARNKVRTVVLPEATDTRILKAASIAAQQGIAKPILLGEPEQVQQLAKSHDIDISTLSIIEPDKHPKRSEYVDAVVQKRQHRGMDASKADTALTDPVTFACMMVARGDADACVAGAINPTAHVVGNAMRYVGKSPDTALISSCFVMLLESHHPVEEAMVIGDCALVIDPNPEELASIAIATGQSATQFLGLTPEVAMLSFSTNGSARHAAVSKVTQATEIARTLRPDWRIVGEVQLDAAVVPSILAVKAPMQATDSPCNVLIFPNLDAGNIGYKLIQRFGGAEAIGPILQGLSHPVNDLSRGCNVEDIVKLIAISCVQVDDKTSSAL